MVILCCRRRRKDHKGKQSLAYDDVKLAATRPLSFAENPIVVETSIDSDYSYPLPKDLRHRQVPPRMLDIGKTIGKGFFGMVKKGYLKSRTKPVPVALKFLKGQARGDFDMRAAFFEEAVLQDSFDHPNIVKLLAVCSHSNTVCLCFEYMAQGDLKGWLQTRRKNDGATVNSIGCTTLANFGAQAAAALSYLEEQSCVHRDVACRYVVTFFGDLIVFQKPPSG